MTKIDGMVILAQAAEDAEPGMGAGLMSMAPLLIMIVLFYFILIRPQMKKQKQHDKMVSEIKSGTNVIVAGGIYGNIANVKEKSFVVKIADNVKIEIQKNSVSQVLSEGYEKK